MKLASIVFAAALFGTNWIPGGNNDYPKLMSGAKAALAR
jgi:hypothetical protein